MGTEIPGVWFEPSPGHPQTQIGDTFHSFQLYVSAEGDVWATMCDVRLLEIVRDPRPYGMSRAAAVGTLLRSLLEMISDSDIPISESVYTRVYGSSAENLGAGGMPRRVRVNDATVLAERWVYGPHEYIAAESPAGTLVGGFTPTGAEIGFRTD